MWSMEIDVVTHNTRDGSLLKKLDGEPPDSCGLSERGIAPDFIARDPVRG